jgi:four helix bundle protein
MPECRVPVRDFEDLIVWQKAVDLAADIYALTQKFPREELYGITAQLRKAAVSVSSNIAEGSGRWTTKDYVHFLINSRGSLYEVRSLLQVSLRLRFTTEAKVVALTAHMSEIGRMLAGLRAGLLRHPRT